MRKIFKVEQNMISFISKELNERDNVAIVIHRDILDEVLDNINFDDEVTYSSFQEDDEESVYLIDKYTYDKGISLFIQPVEFDEDYYMETEIEQEVVIVDEDVLSEEDIDCNIIFEEEIIRVSCEYSDETERAVEMLAQALDEVDEEEIDEELEAIDECLDKIVNDIIDELADATEDADIYCILKEALVDTFYLGRKLGVEDICLNVSDSLLSIIE